MATAETARLIASLELKDKFTGQVSKALVSVGKLETRLDRIGGIAARGVGTAVRNLERIGLIAGGVVVGGIVKATQAAGDFEASLNTINTVAQENAAGLAAIGEGIRTIARDTGTSVDDLAQAYYDLVSAGIQTADAQNVLTEANKLAIGGLSTTAEAVDLLTTAINSYGGDASRAAEYTNQFAQAIAAGKVTAAELAGSFAVIGPIAANFGLGIDEISAALGVMTAKGTPAAEAFTQMRAAIKLLEKPTGDLKKLQRELGVDFLKIAKEKGIVFAYNEIAKAAKKAGIPMTALTGRIEAAQFAAQVTGESFEDYNAELDRVRKSSEGAGVAQEQMSQRTQGFNFAMQRLKANVHDAAITIGSELLPEFADLATEATGWITAHRDEIRQFGKDLGAGIREAVKWARSLDWDSIGRALGIAAGFAKGLIATFSKLPPEAQATILALGGLNKLSGGAVSGIVGELGKGLIKGVLGMTAGVVNARAGVVNVAGGVPGPGTPGTGTGVAGAVGVGLAGAAGVGAAALAHEIGTAVNHEIAGSNDKLAADFDRALELNLGMAFGPFETLRNLPRHIQALADAISGDKPTPSGTGPKINPATGFDLSKAQPVTDKAAAKVQADALAAIRGSEQTTESGLSSVQAATRLGTSGIMIGASSNAGRIVGAIQANRPIVTTRVEVNVTASQVTKSVTVQNRYGAGNGSAGGGPGGNRLS